MRNLWQSKTDIFFVLLLTFFGLYFYFGNLLFSLNNFIYSFGGDAYVIYYDILYYVKYGKAFRLNAMNYPHGELIFMTDAQGSLAVLLRWIHTHLFSIDNYVVGIIHGFNLFSVFVASILIYYLLKALKIQKEIAIVFSVIIILMCPQILRISGHFGLAYPFIIPLVLLWSLQKFNFNKIEFRDALVFFIFLFFAFNNAYLSFTIFILLASLSFFIFNKEKRRIAIWMFVLGFFVVLVPYLFFQFYDIATDRLKIQWGYFAYATNVWGMICPQNSIVERALKGMNAVPYKELDFESMQNLGIVTIGLLISLLFNKLFFKNKITLFPFLKIMLWAALPIFLYATSLMFNYFDQEWIEEKIFLITMFKASARFMWSVYFILSIAAVFVLNYWYCNFKNKKIALVFFGISILVSGAELNNYFKENFFQSKGSENLLSEKQLKDFKIENDIPAIEKYQAMLLLPKIALWNDNFLSDLNWDAQHYGFRFSLAYQMPLISAMLSRFSVGEMTEAIELLANPLIEKSLPSKFPNKKNILLLVAKNVDSFSSGERFLISQGTKLISKEKYDIYSLSLNKINNNNFQNEAKLNAEKYISDSNKALLNFHFDETKTNINYFGGGAKLFPKGKNKVFDTIINVQDTTLVNLSAWRNFNSHRYGSGEWFLEKSKDGITYSEINIGDTRYSNEINDDWIRFEKSFYISDKTFLRLHFSNIQATWLDEICLKKEAQLLIYKNETTTNSFLFNNFKVKK